MPAKSKAQLRWVNSPAGHRALGEAGVREWDRASKGLKLPERKSVLAFANEFQITSIASISNVQNDRPPLALMFGRGYEGKWDAAEEEEMLTKAAAAVAAADPAGNAANLIHSALREDLPQDRKRAVDLSPFGIKLG